MKAIIFDDFGGVDVLQIKTVVNPKPGAGELLINTHATALNRADLLQRQGHYPPPPGASDILGLEVAGTVEAMGADVEGVSIGDRVCGLLAGGAYAEKVILPARLALPIPAKLSFAEAAAIPEVFLTAYQAIYWLAQLQAGERILIHAGGSGVGTAAIQLAQQLEAGQIIITASVGKHDFCQSLGATDAIDYRAENFAERTLELTEGKGVDVVIDFVGGPNFAPNLEVLAPDGRMVMLAFLGGVKTGNLNLLSILRKRLRIMGSTLRARDLDYKSRLTHDFQRDCWAAFADGNLRPVIDSVYPWTQVQEAHEHMASNANIGKIVLKVQ